MVTVNLRVIYCAVLTVYGVNNLFNSESCRKTWYILCLKKKAPGLKGYVRVGAVVFTQRVFVQGGLIM